MGAALYTALGVIRNRILEDIGWRKCIEYPCAAAEISESTC